MATTTRIRPDTTVPAPATASRLKTRLRGGQQIAVDTSASSFIEGYRRVSVYMATGTGKTLVALHVVQETAPEGASLVAVPSLRLLEQTAAKWHSEGRPGRYLGVCSSSHPADPYLADVLTMVGTADDLAWQAADTPGPLNVFCTYDSLDKVVEAHRDFHLPRWDVVVADEAHRTAGDYDKPWARIHHDDKLPARHRLYMTATPRVFDEKKAREKGINADTVIASMDDVSIYGPVVYRISLREAIDEGLLADYRIAGVVIRDEDLRGLLNRLPANTWTGEALRAAAAQVALLVAQHRYDLRRTLTFHPCIAAADVFAETLHETAALMPPAYHAPLQVGTVSSRQSPFERHKNYTDFASAPLNTPASQQPPRRAVLTNCRCCAEGVDIPAIDSLLFAHPKTSSIDIIQSIGRALRQTPGDNKISTIVIPIYMAPGETLEEAVKKTAFHLIYRVLIDLDVYDEHTFHLVDHFRYPSDPTATPQIAPRPERADEIIPVLDLNDVMAPNRVWEAAFEVATDFYLQNGHLDVPSRYLHDGRFYLGWWIGAQRSMRKNGLLLPERIAALDTLGMIWEHPPHSIERKLLIARDYVTRHGHLAPRWVEHHQGLHLGRWLADSRKEANTRRLPHCYQRALNEIYPWWNTKGRAEWKRTYARAHAAARDKTLIFPGPHQLTGAAPVLTQWLAEQIDNLAGLEDYQRHLMGDLPIEHPLALLLRRPRGSSQRAFARGLKAAYAYRCRHQHLDVPYNYTCEDGFALGRWLAEKRRFPQALSREQLDALEALDMRWISRHRHRTP
ncbi:DEAD/DEAH box helicase [Streptomyces sp. NBC_00847]|uniref:DEAD/DEAH box helicase n=1 Tax=Streptomyces sp. NBC_00847 TaxID=2975850 RepID=UPI0022543B79|nr:DEAD/DEAH box helicase [Streptomyces sp. NBC_00847]MCX4878081.1 Helicase associated domain protein [Streptomyces sp. NBC_00847]